MPILTLSYGTVVQWALALLLVAYPRQDVCTDLFPGIGKLQMKSRSYIFAKNIAIHHLTGQNATGNKKVQPEVEFNEYSSS